MYGTALFFALMLTACANASSGLKCVSDGTASVKTLEVIPKRVRKGESFMVVFPAVGVAHPRQFLIESPAKESIFLIHDDFPGSIMTEEAFLACEAFEVDTKLLKGIDWDHDGRSFMKKVFEKKGMYTLHFADNLETEAENTFSLSVDIEVK